ncbi:hypothetical protein ABBQ38_003809 [Trebouxia sp. C0009 RCD-2024]
MFWIVVLLLPLTVLASLRAARIVDWFRAAWILRSLRRPEGNVVFSGVKRLLTGKRLRVMQNLNEAIVAGSGVFYYNILWGHMVVVSEPRLVAQLLHNGDLAKPTEPVMVHFRQLMSPSGKADFLSAEGDAEDWLWKAVRRGVAPAFAPSALRAVYPKVSQVGARLVEILHGRLPHDPIDMSEVCMCETIDALGLAGFDKAFHSIEAIRQGQRAHMLDIIYTANEEVARGLYNPAYKLLQMLPGPRSRGQECIHKFHSIMQDLLQEMKSRGPPQSDDDSIAAHLMRIRDPRTDQLLSDDLLLPQVSVLFWAGFDTTGNTMAWTLYCISQHPQVEAKIAEELWQQGLLATPEEPHPRAPDYADLGKLTYLSCVIKEAMRIHTVVGLPTLRMSKHRDLVLDGGKLVIPRNTTIWIPLGLPHTSSAIYDSPDQFLPERWLEPNAEYMPARRKVTQRG